MRSLAFTAALIASCANGVRAQTAAQFDLVCSGQVADRPPTGGGPAVVSDWRAALHIDLARLLFCEDSCATSSPIQRVDPEVIVFFSLDRPNYDAAYWSKHLEVSRRNGAYHQVVVSTNLSSEERQGTCVTGPLTLLPKSAPALGG